MQMFARGYGDADRLVLSVVKPNFCSRRVVGLLKLSAMQMFARGYGDADRLVLSVVKPNFCSRRVVGLLKLSANLHDTVFKRTPYKDVAVSPGAYPQRLLAVASLYLPLHRFIESLRISSTQKKPSHP